MLFSIAVAPMSKQSDSEHFIDASNQYLSPTNDGSDRE